MNCEDLIRQAAQEYEQALDVQLPEPETHTFSSRFQRKMKARLAQAEYGKAYLVVRRVACIFLVALLCGSALMAVPSVRASVLNWFVLRDDYGGAAYLPNGSGDAAGAGEYGIGWVPEGFALDDRYQVTQSIRYLTEDRQMIVLTWKSRAEGGMSVGGWSDKVYGVTIDGRPADVYVETKVIGECTVVWTNADESTIFFLTTNCDEETTIRIAESVYLIQP